MQATGSSKETEALFQILHSSTTPLRNQADFQDFCQLRAVNSASWKESHNYMNGGHSQRAFRMSSENKDCPFGACNKLYKSKAFDWTISGKSNLASRRLLRRACQAVSLTRIASIVQKTIASSQTKQHTAHSTPFARCNSSVRPLHQPKLPLWAQAMIVNAQLCDWQPSPKTPRLKEPPQRSASPLKSKLVLSEQHRPKQGFRD